MAGSKTKNKNMGLRGGQRTRFEKGTDNPVIRLMVASGRTRFVWAVKEGDSYRHVPAGDTELR